MADLTLEDGISRATYFNRPSKSAGVSVKELKRMKEVDVENAMLDGMSAVSADARRGRITRRVAWWRAVEEHAEIRMQLLSKIPPSVARKLGFYVYLYVNPLDHSIFYVGKGKGSRALAHVEDTEKKRVARIIRTIRAAGAELQIEILAHALKSPEVALQVEAAVIDALGIAGLANVVRGWRGAKFGRTPLSELVAQYTRKRASIREPAILIRINQLYRYGMTDAELYDATRSAWVVGERSETAQFAFAVFEAVVREVYQITKWLPAGSTFNGRWSGKAVRRKGRREFVGVIAGEDLRRRYINRYVGHLFTQGAQNPISYVNID